MNRSQVMKTLSYLTDVIGPRLTASQHETRTSGRALSLRGDYRMPTWNPGDLLAVVGR